MSDPKKRIILMTEQASISDGDYVAVDSSGNGTKKFNMGGAMQPATTSKPGLMSSTDKATLNTVVRDVSDLKDALIEISVEDTSLIINTGLVNADEVSY